MAQRSAANSKAERPSTRTNSISGLNPIFEGQSGDVFEVARVGRDERAAVNHGSGCYSAIRRADPFCSGWEVGEYALGFCGLGHDREAMEVVEEALEEGVCFFDVSFASLSFPDLVESSSENFFERYDTDG